MQNNSPFELARAEWLRAQATIITLNEQSKGTDEQMMQALDALAAVEWRLIQTPADGLSEISKRARITMEMFLYDDPSDNRSHLMLAALVTELAQASASAPGCVNEAQSWEWSSSFPLLRRHALGSVAALIRRQRRRESRASDPSVNWNGFALSDRGCVRPGWAAFTGAP
jgi:hypothetical protein